jgi:hypothetical protein
MTETKAGDASWNNHHWPESNPRLLQIETSRSVLHRHCVRCGRDFVTDLLSGKRFAVSVSAISFHRLEDEVTERWLREPCHGTRLPSDDADRIRKIAEFPVSEGYAVPRSPADLRRARTR